MKTLSSKWGLKFGVAILAILCLASRLPQVLDPNLTLDGDECIVGLMAKHFSEGNGIPYFVYGQSYGFSFVEVATIRVFFNLFGVSDLSIKLSMLFLWTIGIIFSYKTFKEIGTMNNKWAPFLVTLIFIFSPVWAVWSMKARGGYITAFVLTSLITYLIFNEKQSKRLYIQCLLGFLMVVIYQAQPLWIAGLIPIVGYHLYQQKWLPHTTFLLAGSIIGTFIFYLLKQDISTFWSPQIFHWSNLSLNRLLLFPNQIYQNFSGSYSYSLFTEPHLSTKVLALIYMGAIFSSLSAGVFMLVRRSKITIWFYALCLSVIATLITVFLTSGDDLRYLLPLFGFALLMLYFLINKANHNKLINFIISVIVLTGAISMDTAKNYNFEDKPALMSLINNLMTRKIEYVFCERGLLQWQIMFYSNEQIIARYKSETDRYPSYVQLVDNALKEGDAKVALVRHLNNQYYIDENPTKHMLMERGFKFTEPDTYK